MNVADELTHFDESGRPRMVDVSAKAATERTARVGRLRFTTHHLSGRSGATAAPPNPASRDGRGA